MSEERLIVIVDDDPAFRGIAGLLLKRQGYQTSAFESMEAFRGLAKEPAAILLDWHLGETDGLKAIPELKRRFARSPVVMVTASSSIELAIRTIKAGAFDFLSKPVDEAHLIGIMAAAEEHHRVLRRLAQLEDEASGTECFEGMIGRSPAMRTVFRIIENVAVTDASVMITGESGTGKELVARAIHARSRRRASPFVALNMAAIPGELSEATLFGHEKGAYTGADRNRAGACEEAAGGTLLLDEITEMPLPLQPKLLRFLQERVFRPVGAARDVQADLRIVSATNRDPLKEVQDKHLRADLYYRLNVVPIVLPPLRERREDILPLAQAAMQRAASQYAKPFASISDEAAKILEAHSWPGNVRELMHAMERVVVLHTAEVISPAMLSAEMNAQIAPITSDTGSREAIVTTPLDVRPLADLEREAIARAMLACEGNTTVAAGRLGISTATMYRRLKEFGIG